MLVHLVPQIGHSLAERRVNGLNHEIALIAKPLIEPRVEPVIP
jgi:hypothetical protein